MTPSEKKLILGLVRLARENKAHRSQILEVVKNARFEKGVNMSIEDMADYFENSGNPEAAKKWKEMHEEYADVVKERNKKAALRNAAFKEKVLKAANDRPHLKSALMSLIKDI